MRIGGNFIQKISEFGGSFETIFRCLPLVYWLGEGGHLTPDECPGHLNGPNSCNTAGRTGQNPLGLSVCPHPHQDWKF